VHYELELTAGPLALAMSAVEYTGATAEIEAFANEKAEDYQGADFVMQCRYALWMLRKDSAAAAAYVADVGNVKGMGWAVAALADLDARDARGVVEARAATLEHPVAKEVFAEALQRMDAQASRQAQVYGAPPVSGRMVWMFGRQSSTENALGKESDNVFVQRAIARTRNAELGVVYEADDSAPDD
jgi:hypothetical protein